MHLSENLIIEFMNEAFSKRLNEFASSIKVDGNQSDILSKGLKLRHKKSRYLYTVIKVSVDDVVLKSPDGVEFLLDKNELEEKYEIA